MIHADSEEKIKRLRAMIDEVNNIVFFGGAGVSTESGIPDFRSQDGLYHQKYKYPPETIVSHDFYVNQPNDFFDFYKDKMIALDAKPNTAHKVLAKLESLGKVKAVVTQNIDGLHYAAGSKTVYELHGSVHRNYCEKCGKFYPVEYIVESEFIPMCECGGRIKPDVVLYGESLDYRTIQQTIEAIQQADLLIVGGTSLSVYPAAGFIDYFKGKYTVVINLDDTARNVQADLVINEKIGEVFEQLHI